MIPIVRTTGLVKRYDRTLAVAGLDLEVTQATERHLLIRGVLCPPLTPRGSD